MRLIKYPNTPRTVWESAIAWWFRSGCQGIIRQKVDIPWVFRLINTIIQILVGEICIFGIQLVDESQIGSMCHLVDDSLECLCHSGHCDHHDWFMCQSKCWIPVRRCCLDLQQAVGHRIQPMERIPLPLFTDNAGKVVYRQNHPLFKGIPL